MEDRRQKAKYSIFLLLPPVFSRFIFCPQRPTVIYQDALPDSLGRMVLSDKWPRQFGLIGPWRALKRSPLRRFLAHQYYRIRGTRWRLRGQDNQFNVNLNGHFPFLKNVCIDVQGSHNHIEIGSNVRLQDVKISIQGSYHRLHIKENCQIYGGCLWMENSHGQLRIGRDTTIGEALIGVSEDYQTITIGQDCMFAHGIDIRCGDSHAILDVETGQRLNPARSIKIADHVWLGPYVRILKGVHIGSHSVIGMGAIVTRSIPDHASALGIPARVQRRGITWTRQA